MNNDIIKNASKSGVRTVNQTQTKLENVYENDNI